MTSLIRKTRLPSQFESQTGGLAVKVRLPDGQVVSGRLTRKPTLEPVGHGSFDLTEALLDLSGGGIVTRKFVHAVNDPVMSVTKNWMRVGRSLRAAARKFAIDGPKPTGKAAAQRTGR